MLLDRTGIKGSSFADSENIQLSTIRVMHLSVLLSRTVKRSLVLRANLKQIIPSMLEKIKKFWLTKLTYKRVKSNFRIEYI